MVLKSVLLAAAFCGVVLSQKIDNSYVVQVAGDCNAACLDSIASNAGSNCAATYLGNDGAGTASWVSIDCATESSSLATGSSFISAAESSGVVISEVEENTLFSIFELWGADQVDGTPGDGERCASSKLGKNIIIAVMDTGCTPKGSGFDAIKCKNYVSDGKGTDYCADGHSHGTHVAGTAASGFYGVAPEANVACLRVLGDNGSGSLAGIISAINDVAAFSRADKKKKIVINMSLGGGKSTTLNNAVVAATKKTKIYFAIAAGNSNMDASQASPASASNGKKIIAVGAHDRNGNKAGFSNYGSKVQISAPGVSIESTIPGGTTGSKDGTSMAAPHVAGAMAALWSSKGLNPKMENLHQGNTISYTGGDIPKLEYKCL